MFQSCLQNAPTLSPSKFAIGFLSKETTPQNPAAPVTKVTVSLLIVSLFIADETLETNKGFLSVIGIPFSLLMVFIMFKNHIKEEIVQTKLIKKMSDLSSKYNFIKEGVKNPL